MKRSRYDANERTSWGDIISKNFVGGLVWGLGTVVGATIVLSFFINTLKKLDFIPIVADMVVQIQKTIESRR